MKYLSVSLLFGLENGMIIDIYDSIDRTFLDLMEAPDSLVKEFKIWMINDKIYETLHLLSFDCEGL